MLCSNCTFSMCNLLYVQLDASHENAAPKVAMSTNQQETQLKYPWRVEMFVPLPSSTFWQTKVSDESIGRDKLAPMRLDQKHQIERRSHQTWHEKCKHNTMQARTSKHQGIQRMLIYYLQSATSLDQYSKVCLPSPFNFESTTTCVV